MGHGLECFMGFGWVSNSSGLGRQGDGPGCGARARADLADWVAGGAPDQLTGAGRGLLQFGLGLGQEMGFKIFKNANFLNCFISFVAFFLFFSLHTKYQLSYKIN